MVLENLTAMLKRINLDLYLIPYPKPTQNEQKALSIKSSILKNG